MKALVTAMSSNLSDRLGHMVNRKIHLAPFSRKTLLDDGTLELLFSLWEECCKDRGILLTQPEHLQSFSKSCILSSERVQGSLIHIAHVTKLYFYTY